MAVIGEPQRVWELPAPLDIPSDTPLETEELPTIPVKEPEKVEAMKVR